MKFFVRLKVFDKNCKKKRIARSALFGYDSLENFLMPVYASTGPLKTFQNARIAAP